MGYARHSKCRARKGLRVRLPPPAPFIMKTCRLISNDLDLRAYVIGLALGDGNLSNPNGRAIRLRITCTTEYPQLLNNIQLAIKQLLPHNKVSLASKVGNCVDVSCYSNHWENLLGWKVGLGSKFEQGATVPLWIHSQKSYVINCLKGLIETDGCLYIDRGYPMIGFVSIIPALAEAFIYMVNSLGFTPRTYLIQPPRNSIFNQQPTYRIRLSKRVSEFLNIVQPIKA